MYLRRTPRAKRDPVRRWALPERVFFACGACQVLAYAFLRKFPEAGFGAWWIRPRAGFTGNHIVVRRGEVVFDYHGYSDWAGFREHTWRRARQWWPGWDATVVPVPLEVLVCAPLSRTYDGLWLREPRHFLHDALPRAERYLARFGPPAGAGAQYESSESRTSMHPGEAG